MSNLSYGILNSGGGFVCSSRSIRGAKTKATRDGVDQIYAMHANSWAVWLVAKKENGRWISVKGFDLDDSTEEATEGSAE